MATFNTRLKAATSALFGSGGITPGTAQAPEAGTGVFAPMSAEVARDIVHGMSAGDLYSTQPHLRTVVSFVARNTAQLGRHVYRKTANGRERVETGVLPELLNRPNEYMTGYDLFDMLFSELALYDMAVWVPSLRAGRWVIDPIPAKWIVGIKASTAFETGSFKVLYPGQSQPTLLPRSDVVVFRGYSPDGFARGSSAVQSLKGILEEQVAALDFRRQLWKRGGRVGNFLTRPADAPVWSKEAKQKFVQAWRASYSGDGGSAGSTPLLEDGMKLETTRFNAKEEQWLEAATLSLATIAGAYHVPPAMVGVSGYNSFASVKEFRKMLYTESMGPSIAQVEDTVNTFLAPFVGAPADQYLELNIAEKLQGDFEEQGQIMQAAVGGPYMTPNEGRARFNLPKIEGGDKLLAPLNMGAAGNNGPVASVPIEPDAPEAGDDPSGDDDPQKARKAASEARSPRHDHATKAPAQLSEDDLDGLKSALAAYFDRQRKAVESAVKTKDPEWWDHKRWTRELKALLAPILLQLSADTARQIAGSKGLDPDAYSEGQTLNFLMAVSESRADLINATTRDALKKALDSAPEDVPAPAAVKSFYEETNADRPNQVSRTLGTFVAGFAATEVAKQLMSDGSSEPTKTWVTSGSPDSRHADMDGETVPVGKAFSNGAQWPGDPVLGAEGVANCLCGVDINN